MVEGLGRDPNGLIEGGDNIKSKQPQRQRRRYCAMHVDWR